MRRDQEDQQPGAEDTGGGAPTTGHRLRWVAAGALTVAAVAVAGVAASSQGDSGDTAAGQASQGTATTKIVKQDLVEQETVDGTLGYSDARAVINRLSGTVTWTPRVGSVVETNHRLYEVDGKAVYLLDGAYPAYRTLQSGTEGDDVLALERNLRSLGLDRGRDMSVDGTWDSGTTAAVKRWQDRKGLSETGSIEKGRIVFQPGARRIGDVALRAGESASGGASGGGGNAPASTGTTTAVLQNASMSEGGSAELRTVALVEPATTPTTPSSTTPPAESPAPQAQAPRPAATPKPAAPQGPTSAPSQARPAQSGGGSAPGGQAAGSGGAAPSGSGASSSAAGGASSSDVSSTLMTTTSVKRIVAVDLETTKQALATIGGEVSVELPDGKDVDGTIATISKVAQKKAASGDEDPPATIKVVIKLKRSAGTSLDQAPVDVSLEKTRAKGVLTVPVTALIARQGGSFAVEVRDGAARKVVEVETGLYTDSYVEIDGAGLTAGMTVTNARV